MKPQQVCAVRNSVHALVRPAIASAAVAGLLVLGACERSSTPTASDREIIADLPAAQRSAAQDCLLVIWNEQETPDREFDRQHDEVTGGAISCATGTSASEFEAALAAIRAAAAANDRPALMRQLGIPLLYIDSNGERHDVLEDELVEAIFDEVFSPEMLSVMQDLHLEDMTVVPDQGAFFELGSLWLVADRPGGRPRLVTVNQQALGEAIIAARRSAEDGHSAEHAGR